MYVCICHCIFCSEMYNRGKESVRDLAANSNFMATISTGGRAALKLRNSFKLVSLQFGI
jgi:hypothetical protein